MASPRDQGFPVTGKVKHAGLSRSPWHDPSRGGGGICGGSARAAHQGRPDGGPSAASSPRASWTRRSPTTPAEARLLHGLGRDDRDGRDRRPGRAFPVLPGLLRRRVVRQVRPVPNRCTQMLRLLDRIAAATGNEGDIATIRRLAHHAESLAVRARQALPTRFFRPCATSNRNSGSADLERQLSRVPTVTEMIQPRSTACRRGRPGRHHPRRGAPGLSPHPNSLQAPGPGSHRRLRHLHRPRRGLDQDAARLLHAGRGGHGDHDGRPGSSRSAGRSST